MTSPEVDQQESPPKQTVLLGDPQIRVAGIDCIWHNLYADPTDYAFNTFRCFQWDAAPDGMLARLARHVAQGLYEIVSVSLSAHSCVVMCTSKLDIKDWPADALG